MRNKAVPIGLAGSTAGLEGSSEANRPFGVVLRVHCLAISHVPGELALLHAVKRRLVCYVSSKTSTHCIVLSP